MNERISMREVPRELVTPMQAMGKYLKTSGLDGKLLELVKYRVSQINGCAFCLDMHHKDALDQGETEQRLHTLPAWRECPWYSEKERAALSYTESLIEEGGAEDAGFGSLKSFFTKGEIVDLTFVILLTQNWNLLNIAFRCTPGGYRVGQFG